MFKNIWWILPLIATILAIAGVAYGQDAPVPPDVSVLVQALDVKAWWVIAAWVVVALVYVSKLPLLGNTWEKIPKQYRAYVVLGLGVLSGVAQAVILRQPWLPVLIQGLLSGLLALGTDQAITAHRKAVG